MPPAKLAEATKSILTAYREMLADKTFTAEDAQQFWGGSEAKAVKDLTDQQMLQLVIHLQLWDLQTLRNSLEQAVAANQKLLGGNREQRRAQAKNWR